MTYGSPKNSKNDTNFIDSTGKAPQMCLNLKTDNGDAMTDRRSDYLATPRSTICCSRCAFANTASNLLLGVFLPQDHIGIVAYFQPRSEAVLQFSLRSLVHFNLALQFFCLNHKVFFSFGFLCSLCAKMLFVLLQANLFRGRCLSSRSTHFLVSYFPCSSVLAKSGNVLLIPCQGQYPDHRLRFSGNKSGVLLHTHLFASIFVLPKRNNLVVVSVRENLEQWFSWFFVQWSGGLVWCSGGPAVRRSGGPVRSGPTLFNLTFFQGLGPAAFGPSHPFTSPVPEGPT